MCKYGKICITSHQNSPLTSTLYKWWYFAGQCRHDNRCNFWSFAENLNTEETKCSLLPTCEKTEVAPHPWLTTSGSQDCLPEPYKRRACSPACPQQAKFCHGRCAFFGAKCFFAPCSPNPCRTSSTKSCTVPSLHLMLKMEYAEPPVCTTGQSVRDALNGLCQNNALNCLETLAGIVPPQS